MFPRLSTVLRTATRASPALHSRAMATASTSDVVFLGLDSSTQGVKATLVSGADLRVLSSSAINYSRDLPHYSTVSGVHVQPGTSVVTQPTLMYVEALDMLLRGMKASGAPFHRVAAVSGSGQQHGSIYWATGARAALRGMRGGSPLVAQLSKAFSVGDSPIWMDSSTTRQCEALTRALPGGGKQLASITGSRAYERFTGNQIAKMASVNAAGYAGSERISLISSGMCSVMLGDYAGIDTSDGSGMNLMDIKSKAWSDVVLRAMPGAAGLADKLGVPVPSHACLGTVSRYFTDEYGIPADCKVIAWSGDNPCSVAGLGLRAPGDVAISLGTSDTMFGITGEPTPGEEGHIFVNPVDPASYMAMLCYKNGSITRERVRDAAAGGDWAAFNAVFSSTPAGNDGCVGFFFDQPEITPTVAKAGTRRFRKGADGRVVRLDAFPTPAHEVRAVVEGQFLSMRVHGESVGITHPKRLIATGGASSNTALTQVLSDVFGAPVYTASQPDSASLGAAYRAAHGWVNATSKTFIPFDRVLAYGAGAATASASTPVAAPITLKLAASPNAAAHDAYTRLLPTYKAAEALVLAE